MSETAHNNQANRTVLEEFEARRSPEGRFHTYCLGRVRHFWIRQALVVILFPFFYKFAGPEQTMIALLVVLTGEFLDLLTVRPLSYRRTYGHELRKFMMLTTLSSVVQAIALTYAIWLATQVEGDTRAFSTALCLIGTFEAGLLFGLHRLASIAKIAVFQTFLFFNFLDLWTNIADPEVSQLIFEFVGAALLTYVGALFVMHMHRIQYRKDAAQRATLERSAELAEINNVLSEIRQKTKRLAMVAENANDSMIISDAQGRIQWVNPAFTETMGYSFDEAVGMPTNFLNGPSTEATTIRKIKDAREQKKPIRIELVNLTKDGQPIWVEASLTPIIDETGELTSIIGVERDITETKRRQEILAKARFDAEEASRAKNSFLATMSHEIRTPMNGVLATSDLLSETNLDPEQRSLVETISSSGEALLTIINDILDFSKLDAGKLDIVSEPFSLHGCIQGAIDLIAPLAESKALSLKVTVPPDLPTIVVGDDGRIRQVLLNLLGNAIKFTLEGIVALKVDYQVVDGKNCVTIAVQDTGVGISENRLSQIFDTFTQADASITRRFGGTGLGLSISRKLVEAMGGSLDAKSTEGIGSLFSLSIPVEIADQPILNGKNSVKPETYAAISASNARILVAEDNRTNRLLLQKMLAPFGFKMEFAENGAIAVDFYTQRPPDLVLMDVSMPVMDGLEAATCIRELEQNNTMDHVPIVALTANAFAEDKRRCLDAGMDGHLTKPFRKADLLDMISRYLPPHEDVPQKYSA